MNKKIIVLGLLLINLKMICSENQIIPKAVPCEISYDNQAINILMKSNSTYPRYGFEGNTLFLLNLKEKHGRGFISSQNDLLERLILSKEQTSMLLSTAQKTNYFSSNADFKSVQYFFHNPIDIMVRKDGTPIFYRVYALRHINSKPPIDDAGYNSGTDTKFYYSVGGMAVGIVIGGSFVTCLVFAAAIKNSYLTKTHEKTNSVL